MKKITLIILCSIPFFTYAQKIKLVDLNRSNISRTRVMKNLVYLKADQNLDSLEYIATFRLPYFKLEQKFNELWTSCGQIGANAFQLKNIEKDSTTQEIYLQIKVYYGTKSLLKSIFKGYEKNVIYVFNTGKFTEEILVNGEKRLIVKDDWTSIKINEGQTLTIDRNIGLGIRAKLRYEKGQSAIFWTDGKKRSNTATTMRFAQAGLIGAAIGSVIQNREIDFVNPNLGFLMVEVHKKIYGY